MDLVKTHRAQFVVQKNKFFLKTSDLLLLSLQMSFADISAPLRVSSSGSDGRSDDLDEHRVALLQQRLRAELAVPSGRNALPDTRARCYYYVQ